MEQGEVMQFAASVLDELQIEYAVVGSFASMAYGEVRLTRDIDIVVSIPTQLCASFCLKFPAPEWYLSESAVREALRQRRSFNVLHPSSGNKLDFMVSSDDEWGQFQMSRRQSMPILPGLEVQVAHPEDVILGKLRYYQEGGSDKHLRDIVGMLEISGEDIDLQRLEVWAEKLSVIDVWNEVASKWRERQDEADNGSVPF